MTNVIQVPDFSAGKEIIALHNTLQEGNSFSLDFSAIGFAKPSGMILLSQVIRSAVVSGVNIKARGAQPYSYPANVGFYEACLIDVPRHEAPGGENYLPLRCVDLDAWRQDAQKNKLAFGELANQRVGNMAYLISRTTSGDLFDLIKYCLREIVRNAMEHGCGSEMWLCGQYWPTKDEVELCIFDRGRGVRRSLIENRKFASVDNDRDAIRLALLPSISGKRIYEVTDEIDSDDGSGKWENSGFGLYVTSQLAKNNGYFVIGSGDSYQQLSGAESKKGEFGLKGTYISINVNVAGLNQTVSRVDEIVKKGESFARRYVSSGAEVLASAASKVLVE